MIKKAKSLLEPGEFEKIEVIQDGNNMNFKGPKEIVEKLVKELKVK
jgi:hypothetical protein